LSSGEIFPQIPAELKMHFFFINGTSSFHHSIFAPALDLPAFVSLLMLHQLHNICMENSDNFLVEGDYVPDLESGR
jgi:hypothetical protein